MRSRTIATLLLLMAAAAAGAQPAAEPRAATIRGRVSSEDGKPLRRALVVLLPTATAANIRITASTNSLGQYTVRDVPPGTYRVRVERSGYVAREHGQRIPNQPGRTLDVRAGQELTSIDVSLPRGAVIAGRVLDEAGEPFAGVRVQAQQLRYAAGRLAPFPGVSAITDDFGEYRISGLEPGTYVVAGSSTETWLNDKKLSVGFAETYFPGETTGGQPIVLAGGQERTNLDFVMTVSRTSRISGVARSAAGAPAAAQPVALNPEYREFGYISTIGALRTSAAADGSFEFQNVPPGKYQLRSSSGDGEVAVLHIDVTGEDIPGLVLARQVGSRVSGVITTDDGSAPDFQSSRVRIEPIATDRARMLDTPRFMPDRVAKPDWTFSVPNIAGPFLFRVVGLPEEWMIGAVRVQGTDVTDVATEVPTGGKDIAGVEIVLTKKVATVGGSVVDGDGKPVPGATIVVFTEDRDLWGPGTRFIKTARPSEDGAFAVTGLPRGTYRAFASTDIADGQWEDVDFLERVLNTAERVTLAEGSTASLTLRVGPQ
jgi:protocatechuate 3,4-dioxygenase beta subunit